VLIAAVCLKLRGLNCNKQLLESINARLLGHKRVAVSKSRNWVRAAMRYLDGNYFAWQVKQTGRKVVGDANPFLAKMIKMKDAAPTWVRLIRSSQISCISMLLSITQSFGRIIRWRTEAFTKRVKTAVAYIEPRITTNWVGIICLQDQFFANSVEERHVFWDELDSVWEPIRKEFAW
jgi:hypothetical protein